jgi:hypothetical protein
MHLQSYMYFRSPSQTLAHDRSSSSAANQTQAAAAVQVAAANGHASTDRIQMPHE